MINNTKLNIEHKSYKNLITINEGWKKCSVFGGTEIKQYFKGKGLNHIAEECRNLYLTPWKSETTRV